MEYFKLSLKESFWALLYSCICYINCQVVDLVVDIVVVVHLVYWRGVQIIMAK